MIKDTFFSWSRFQLLLKKNILENWKTYGLRLLLMYGVLTIGMIWNGYFSYIPNNPYPNDNSVAFTSIFFFWMLCIFGALGASFIMEDLKTKTNKISFLMTPATQFEKFFMKWFIYVVAFLMTYLLLFKVADCTKVLLYTIIYPQNKGIEVFSFSHIINLNNHQSYCMIQTCRELAMSVSGFLFGQSLFILGGTIWPKNSFVKTFAAIIAVIALGSFVTYQSYKLFYNDGYINFSEITVSRIFIIATSILALFNWTIAYFRFKETEIINRM